MPGHRRISTDLFLEHINRKGPRSKVEALLELDLDDWKEDRKSVRAYARLWRWSREKVAALIVEYEAHKDDLKTPIRGESRPATDRPPIRPQTGHLEGHESSTNTDSCTISPTTEPATNRPPTRPQTGHILEQEPEQEGRESPPPSKPSAQKVEKSESDRRRAAGQIRLVLGSLPPEAEERRARRIRRLEILADGFLGCPAEPSAEKLALYFDATRDVWDEHLATAWAQAFATQESTFPPSPKAINQAGQRLAAQARKRATGAA